MKELFKSTLKNKIVVALALSLVMVGVTAIFFSIGGHMVFGDTVVPPRDGSGGSSGEILPGDGDGEGSGGGSGGGTALTSRPLCGFAWNAINENSAISGIGWVDFNSCDTNRDGILSGAETSVNTPGGCRSDDAQKRYVSVDSNGNLFGFAWSDNIGWVQFGGLGSFPNTNGNSQVNARILTGGILEGWSRVVSGFNSVAGEWDGWISLKGTSPSHGVTLNSNNIFNGFSWGNDAIGWLKWDAYAGHEVRYCVVPELEVSLSPSLATQTNPGQYTVPFEAVAMPARASGDSDVYIFNCDNGFDSQNNGSDNTFNCVYNLPPGSPDRTPTVRIERNRTLIATASSVVRFLPDTSTLSVTCTPPTRVIVNREARFNIAVNTPGTANYTYNYSFGAGSNPATASHVVAERTDSAVTTYSTIGIKTLTVQVNDSSTPQKSGTGICTFPVVVQPIIIER